VRDCGDRQQRDRAWLSPVVALAVKRMHGLDEADNRILSTIISKFKRRPMGITTIAAAWVKDGHAGRSVRTVF